MMSEVSSEDEDFEFAITAAIAGKVAVAIKASRPSLKFAPGIRMKLHGACKKLFVDMNFYNEKLLDKYINEQLAFAKQENAAVLESQLPGSAARAEPAEKVKRRTKAQMVTMRLHINTVVNRRGSTVAVNSSIIDAFLY